MCAMLAFSFLVSPLSSGEELSVISSICYIYSSADFSTPIVDEGGKEIVLHHGDKLIALQEEGDFIKVKTTDEIEGYVFKFYVTSNKNGQDVYPVFNGKVLTDKAEIFNVDETTSGFTANRDQEIYIYGAYSGKKEFTEIAIVLEDGSLFYGLMKTSDIKANGISPALITSITLIIALVTIILAVVFIRKNKTKKAKEK